MDSAKNERWIIPFKKFGRIRVKLLTIRLCLHTADDRGNIILCEYSCLLVTFPGKDYANTRLEEIIKSPI